MSCLCDDAAMQGFIRVKAAAHTHPESRVKDRAEGLALLIFALINSTLQQQQTQTNTNNNPSQPLTQKCTALL